MPIDDLKLIEGFCSKGRAEELAFVRALQPMVRAEIADKWPRLWQHAADIEQDVFEILLLRRKVRLKGELPIQPPLSELVRRYVNTVGSRFRAKKRRDGDRLAEREGVAALRPTQEDAAELRRMLERVADLPEEQARLLVAHGLHCANQGPPIHVALGIDENSARKRLVRAQAAMQRLLESEEANG